MKGREVADGGRAVEVAPERLVRWFENFARRHDGVDTTDIRPHEVVITGENGTTASVTVPFPPLPDIRRESGRHEGLAIEALTVHACRRRRIGLLLVRKGAHSIGVAEDGFVVVSRTDRHYVQGRTSAGGWSQQRFARRRQGQWSKALRSTADDAYELLGRRVSELDAVVLGGDRAALDELRAQSRLAPVFARAVDRVLDVAEPRRRTLDEAARRARAVEIVIRDAPGSVS